MFKKAKQSYRVFLAHVVRIKAVRAIGFLLVVSVHAYAAKALSERGRFRAEVFQDVVRATAIGERKNASALIHVFILIIKYLIVGRLRTRSAA
mgnify:FL=1|jgi:uncharacterized membrane protein